MSLNVTRGHLLGSAAAIAIAAGLGLTRTTALAQKKRVLRLADGNSGRADPHKPVDFPARS